MNEGLSCILALVFHPHRHNIEYYTVLKYSTQILKALLQPVVRAITCGLRAKNGPSSAMDAGAKYVFWWSLTRRTARSKKTGRPVFLCVLPATSRTHGARREYARQKY